MIIGQSVVSMFGNMIAKRSRITNAVMTYAIDQVTELMYFYPKHAQYAIYSLGYTLISPLTKTKGMNIARAIILKPIGIIWTLACYLTTQECNILDNPSFCLHA